MVGRSISFTIIFGTFVVLVLSCSGDNATGAADSISGRWLYSARYSRSSITCTVTDMTLNVATSRNEISGDYVGGRLQCCSGLTCLSDPLTEGPIAGNIDENGGISFVISSDWLFNDGVLMEGDTMSGTVTAELNSGTMTGTWSAIRE